MPKHANVPSLTQLALQYGTITRDQYMLVSSLMSSASNSHLTEADILLKQGVATRYQIALLRRIQEYLTVRKQSEEFGAIAIKKGYATKKNILVALELQKEAFKASRIKKLIGDILVESKVITLDQKNLVLKEQSLWATSFQAEKPSPPLITENKGASLPLTPYETQFLKIKALDEDFAAAVLEKKIANEQQITEAQSIQEKAFETKGAIKLLGQILVDLKVITPEQNRIILEEQNRSLDKPPDLNLTIELEPDKMAAWVRIAPAASVSLKEIKREVKNTGIRFGVYPDALIQGALERGLLEFPIAKLDYSNALKRASRFALRLGSGLSDKGEKKRGDVLADQKKIRKLPPQKNLFGDLSDRISEHDFVARCGTGTRLSSDGTRYIAYKTGRPFISLERDLYVHPAIFVLEDADQRYGKLESHADIHVSGIITGAHPVTAGNVRATEIRGGRITAVGDLQVEIGITDAVIDAQGDIYATYIHHSTVECFGNLYVANEIIDSTIRCSGKIQCPDCRVISSSLSAKMGIALNGLGSDKTPPCRISAGKDDHLISRMKTILSDVSKIKDSIAPLSREREENKHQIKTIFQKMVELKIFYDRSRKNKKSLEIKLAENTRDLSAAKRKKIRSTIDILKNRMDRSITSLKKLNAAKKEKDTLQQKIEERFLVQNRKIDTAVKRHKQTLFAYVEHERNKRGNPEIHISDVACQGTLLQGIHSQLTLPSDKRQFRVKEIEHPEETWEMEFI